MRVISINLVLLCLLIISVPFDIFSLITIGNRGVKPVWVFGFILVYIFVLNILLKRQNISRSKTGTCIILFNIVAIFSLINLCNSNNEQLIAFLTLWLRLLWCSALFFAIISHDWTFKHLEIVLKLVVSMTIILAIYGIYQMFARSLGFPLAYPPILNPSLRDNLEVVGFTRGGSFGSYVRPSSVFVEPSFFGSYLLEGLILMWVFFAYRKEGVKFPYSRDIFNLIGLITIFTSFILCFSMGAYIAVAGSCCLGLANKKIRIKITKSIIIAIFSIIIIAATLKPFINEDFAKIVYIRSLAHIVALNNTPVSAHLDRAYAKTSVENRMERAKSALAVWSEHPFLGVGLNNFSYYFPADVAGKVHGAFTQILAEMGIFGLTTFALILVVPLISMRKRIAYVRSVDFKHACLIGLYYVLLARCIRFLYAGNWADEKMWIEVAMAVVLLQMTSNGARHKLEQQAIL